MGWNTRTPASAGVRTPENQRVQALEGLNVFLKPLAESARVLRVKYTLEYTYIQSIFY